MADISLYPPIFNKPYMPAFVAESTEGCRVYFSISVYNSLNDLHHPDKDPTIVDGIQVVVQNQKTNQSVLNEKKYPSGIMLTSLNTDPKRNGDDIYFITINNNDIQGGFQYNQYYKVQIRFTSVDVIGNVPSTIDEQGNGIGIDGWLSNNLSRFSEWSTVVLIRPISAPVLTLNGFEMQDEEKVFTINDIILSGRISFSATEDQETLQKYRIRIYDESDNVLEDSGDIYLNSYSHVNQIFYKCKYNFEDEVDYKMGIQILTQNLYSWPEEKKFHFRIQTVVYTSFEANIQAKPDNEGGRIKVSLYRNTFSTLGTNITIRRSSSKDDFNIWEDMQTFLVPPNSILDYTWYDYTIENGVWYLYSAEQRNKEGFKSTSIQILDPVMVVSQDIFLTTEQAQLKIRFNPQVTNFSHTVSQSLTQTIGAKYPFIRRNGNVNYRTFTLSGTITHFMDIRQNLMHSSKEDLYQSHASLYESYNTKNNVTLYNDVIYERDFRKKVIDFLYKNNVKLYKSATEGNILVKLMNISFTPNTTLSRQIYDFTCTAYEIDEFNYDNCIKYNIQNRGQYQDQTNFLFSILGQTSRPTMDIYYKKGDNDNINYKTEYEQRFYSNRQYFDTVDLISTTITNQYQRFATDELDIEVAYLTYLKIELSSKPYLIGIDGNQNPYKISNSSENGLQEGLFLGHIAVINNQYIIIGRDGIYELADDDTEITSLRFISSQETGTLSYEAVLNEKAKQQNMPKEYSNFSRIGQQWGFFNLEDSIYRKILNKYNHSYNLKIGQENNANLYQQQVMSINGIRVQADPGTVFYTRELQDSGFQKHIIGPTGLLEFYDENTNIQGIYFVGPQLRLAQQGSLFDTSYEDYADDDEFIQTGLTYDNFDQIKHPIRNGVYTITTIDSAADASQISTQKLNIIQGLNISAQVLAEIVALAEPASTQTRIKLSDKIISFLRNNSYFNILSTSQKQIFTDLLYQEILKQYISSGNKYIFYKGGWYPFDENNNVVEVPFVQAIVDYYCKLLRKRY